MPLPRPDRRQLYCYEIEVIMCALCSSNVLYRFSNQRRNQFQSTFCHVRCSCYPSIILILSARTTAAQLILHTYRPLDRQPTYVGMRRSSELPRFDQTENVLGSWNVPKRTRRQIPLVRLTNMLHWHWIDCTEYSHIVGGCEHTFPSFRRQISTWFDWLGAVGARQRFSVLI